MADFIKTSKIGPDLQNSDKNQSGVQKPHNKNKADDGTMVNHKHDKKVGGWNLSNETIEQEAYRLWENGFSIDSLSNWLEAERRITESLSK